MKAKQRRKDPARGGASGRADGLTTRNELLEAAGAVFAEHGYAKATSKEICERAGANIAAVNYHFGGKDGLYSAVLEEAHHRLVSLETVAAAVRSDVDPRVKLRMLLTRIVGEITRRDQGGWELRVLSREILSQSPLIEGLLNNQIAPKAKLVRGLIAQIMELPADDPAVSRTVVSVMGPCIFLVIVNKELQRKVAPNLDPDPGALVEHMLTFTLAGMRAVARKAQQ